MIYTICNNDNKMYIATLLYFKNVCGLRTAKEEIAYIRNFHQSDSDNLIVPILDEDVEYHLSNNDCSFSIVERVVARNMVTNCEILDKKIIRINCINDYTYDIDNIIYNIKSFVKNNFKKSINGQIIHFVCNEYGSWENSIMYKCRPGSSLYLPKEIKHNLLNDVFYFCNNEIVKSCYDKMGIHMKRIYLFHGYPGTGKTSASFVMASTLGMNIATIDFTSKIDDMLFRTAVNDIPDNTILLIEDLDHLFSPKKGNDENRHSVTFTALLNILDGILKVNSSLICIITCNSLEHFDKTLLMRIDYSVEFVNTIHKEQIQGMISNIFDDTTTIQMCDNDKQQLVAFFTNKTTTINIIQKWILSHLQYIIMNKYSLVDKLKDFDTYNKWYIHDNHTEQLYN